MHNADTLLKLVKVAALDAVHASKPANVVFGKVLSPKPLKILVNQKLILTEAQLVLSRDVTDYEIEMEPSLNEKPYFHLTEEKEGGTEEATFEKHNHEIKGRKKFLVYNALKSGEDVILIQALGGQKYVVIDRIGKG